MIKIRNIKYIGFIVIFFILTFTWGCRKNDTLNFGDVLLENDKIVFFQQTYTEIEAYTIRNNISRTDNFSTYVLGYNYDPIFGTTKTDIVTQYFPNIATLLGFLSIDSIVLSLQYPENAVYNKSLSERTMNVQIYEILQNIDVEAPYYSRIPNFTTYYDEKKPIGQKEFVFDTLSQAAGSFAIKITDEDFITKFNTELKDPYLLLDSVRFNDIFKGLYITTDSYSSLTNISMDASILRLYGNTNEGKVIYDFLFNNKNINRIERNYTDFYIENEIGKKTSDGFAYIQRLGGTMAKLGIPVLKELKDSLGMNSIVIEATLIVSVDTAAPSYYAQYPPIEILGIYYNDKKNSLIPIDDMFNPNLFGGTYNSSDNKYFFNVTKYIKKIITGERNLLNEYLYVFPVFSNTTKRTIFQVDGDAIKLKISYINL